MEHLTQNASMTYLFTVTFRQTEASFLAHALEASTAAMHSIFSQEEDYRQENEREEA